MLATAHSRLFTSMRMREFLFCWNFEYFEFEDFLARFGFGFRPIKGRWPQIWGRFVVRDPPQWGYRSYFAVNGGIKRLSLLVISTGSYKWVRVVVLYCFHYVLNFGISFSFLWGPIPVNTFFSISFCLVTRMYHLTEVFQMLAFDINR